MINLKINIYYVSIRIIKIEYHNIYLWIVLSGPYRYLRESTTNGQIMKTDHDNLETTVYTVKIKCREIVAGNTIEFNEVIGESTSLDIAKMIQNDCKDSFLEIQEVKKRDTRIKK